MNLDGIYNFNILQKQFRTKILQFQITQQMSGTTVLSLRQINCKNCNLFNHIRDCRKYCKKSFCTDLPSHSADKCINWHPQHPKVSLPSISEFSRVLSVNTPSPASVSTHLDAIVDSTSAITASPSPKLLSNSPLHMTPPLLMVLAEKLTMLELFLLLLVQQILKSFLILVMQLQHYHIQISFLGLRHSRFLPLRWKQRMELFIPLNQQVFFMAYRRMCCILFPIFSFVYRIIHRKVV